MGRVVDHFECLSFVPLLPPSLLPRLLPHVLDRGKGPAWGHMTVMAVFMDLRLQVPDPFLQPGDDLPLGNDECNKLLFGKIRQRRPVFHEKYVP